MNIPDTDWRDEALESESFGAFRQIVAAHNSAFALQVERQMAAQQAGQAVREALRARRKQVVPRQADLATMMGTTQSRISDIERGIGDIGVETLLVYAQAIGVPAAELTGCIMQAIKNAPVMQGNDHREKGDVAVPEY